MTSITAENLLDELRRAADVVTGIAAKLREEDVPAASELPGWTRGHVLAHLAGIADAMARQVEYAARGESIELYDGGFEGRTRAIELSARHSLDQHRADLAAALDRALAAFGGLDAAGWREPISYRGGVVFDGGLALWRELTIHATDLGTGRGPETWSRPFCEHLFEFLAARVPEGERFVLQPLGLPSVALGAAGGRSTVINGMLTDIAAWLAGRTPTLGSLRATAAADGVELPALLPWPAGVPVTK
ncbi:maleylpyruvate isomerase family mycothiol-dependent enzyme [Arthrobacter sp. UKPF54-2]|uniref:maleylpyruvate isomerase family mycothiol-dependent enzyme n=1 Tax=Arthrobacter sp. UKPF54-2 TaxID=2600159 RepID=UPI0011B14C73|nr:maleylpyruvate isomerase family mycothiol-dependent enzyme [Arthrobacter sp. UKPF54-2]QDY91467.1 maleylpyruvate isomerase family mycothiol-dependent enzyme [Arthrobacter sp. UKPF54-2]